MYQIQNVSQLSKNFALNPQYEFSHEGKSLTTPHCHLKSLKSHQSKGNDKKKLKIETKKSGVIFLA